MIDHLLPYASLILKLLQGVVYYDDKAWSQLLADQVPIGRYFAEIGLQLHLDEAEGYAYLSQPDDPENPNRLPRLVRRTPLTYDATLLCVLLRESLQRFDAQSPDASRHIVSRGEIQEMVALFLPTRHDMLRVERMVDRAIKQLLEFDFLKRLNNEHEELYEVRRIVKAKINADVLITIRDQLKAYQEEVEGTV